MSDARTTIPTAPPTGVAPLEAVDVRKTYQLGATQVPVLHGATLSVREGEWLAVMGSSG